MKKLLLMLISSTVVAAMVMICGTLGVSLAGCDDVDHQTHHTETKREAHYIHYYKDSRTNLCFAGQAGEYYSSTLTYVPCSPEVEKLVEPVPEYVGP